MPFRIVSFLREFRDLRHLDVGVFVILSGVLTVFFCCLGLLQGGCQATERGLYQNEIEHPDVEKVKTHYPTI